MKSTLAVKHYHSIFTVPHELNQIYLWDRRLYCNILFRAASRTLHSFGYTHYGCETGAVAVLHIPLGGTGSGAKPFSASAFALHCSGSRLFLVGEMAPYRPI